jgi:hypothetical protein
MSDAHSTTTRLRRTDLLYLLADISIAIRAVAARLNLPGEDRLDLLRLANRIDRLLRRAGIG